MRKQCCKVSGSSVSPYEGTIDDIRKRKNDSPRRARNTPRFRNKGEGDNDHRGDRSKTKQHNWPETFPDSWDFYKEIGPFNFLLVDISILILKG